VLSHTHHFAGSAWIPWVLLALEAALASPTVGSALVLGAVAAGQVFAGSGDLCLMAGFMAAGRALVFVCAGETAWRRSWRSLLVVAGVAPAFAALLSAAQWLPTVAILRSGLRLQMASAGNMYWSLHPASLLDLFVFRLVSDLPVNAAARAALYESREPLFACIYMGAAALVLVTLGLLQPWNRFKTFAATGLALSLVLALGRNTVVYPALLRVTPLAVFRYPSKYVIAVGFFWRCSSGCRRGLAHRAKSPRRAPGWVILGMAAAATGAALAAAAWVGAGPGSSRACSIRRRQPPSARRPLSRPARS
jgi:hypothetical protein